MEILSTNLTSGGKTDLPMAESRSLKLALMLGRGQAALMAWLVDRLHARGHRGLTVSALDFMGQLECGINYASDVARALGVSRQMVAKSVMDLSCKGWLEQTQDPEKGNRKVIAFTKEGKRVISDARAILAELDNKLDTRLASGWAERLTTDLNDLLMSLTNDP